MRAEYVTFAVWSIVIAPAPSESASFIASASPPSPEPICTPAECALAKVAVKEQLYGCTVGGTIADVGKAAAVSEVTDSDRVPSCTWMGTFSACAPCAQKGNTWRLAVPTWMKQGAKLTVFEPTTMAFRVVTDHFPYSETMISPATWLACRGLPD